MRKIKELVEGDTFIVCRHADGSIHFRRGIAWLDDPSIELLIAKVWLVRELGADEADPETPWATHHLRIEVGEIRAAIDVRGDMHISIEDEHHQVCGRCGEVWPCREQRIERLAREMAYRLDDICDHCGKEIGSAWSTRGTRDGRQYRFHIAKKYRGPDGRSCREVAAEKGFYAP